MLRTVRVIRYFFSFFLLVGQPSPPPIHRAAGVRGMVKGSRGRNPVLGSPNRAVVVSVQEKEGDTKEESGVFWKSASVIPSHEYRWQSRALAIEVSFVGVISEFFSLERTFVALLADDILEEVYRERERERLRYKERRVILN